MEQHGTPFLDVRYFTRSEADGGPYLAYTSHHPDVVPINGEAPPDLKMLTDEVFALIRPWADAIEPTQVAPSFTTTGKSDLAKGISALSPARRAVMEELAMRGRAELREEGLLGPDERDHPEEGPDHPAHH